MQFPFSESLLVHLHQWLVGLSSTGPQLCVLEAVALPLESGFFILVENSLAALGSEE